MQIHTRFEAVTIKFCSACGIPMSDLRTIDRYTGDAVARFCSMACAGAYHRGRFEVI